MSTGGRDGSLRNNITGPRAPGMAKDMFYLRITCTPYSGHNLNTIYVPFIIYQLNDI